MRMFVLGLTGPSGSGKGTIGRALETIGFVHLDGDVLVPLVYRAAAAELVSVFGQSVASNGQVDKRALAKAAFASPEATRQLNAILHPKVMDVFRARLTAAEQDGKKGAVLDGAALFESGANSLCDKVICVLAPRQERFARVLLRDKLPEEQIELRFSAQKSDVFYTERADAVVMNEDRETSIAQVLSLLKEWME